MSHRSAKACLNDIFGYDEFRPMQEEIVDHVVSGGDAMVILPTGRGKSLCYQIPSLCREGVGIVISPLLALMHDQVDRLQFLGVEAATLNSKTSAGEARSIMDAARSGNLDLLYVSPERFANSRFQAFLREIQIALFAVDEAHCVSQWGHDFRPEYMNLATIRTQFPGVPRIALTASVDPQTKTDLLRSLDMLDAAVFQAGFDRPNISYAIAPQGKDVKRQVMQVIERHAGHSGIVYCLGRQGVETLARHLRENGIDALPYHGKLDDEVRADNQDAFLTRPGVVMVATVAFGMGIDKADVRFVVHVDVPSSVEAYYQETGRGGRDGLPSEAVLFFSPGSLARRRRMIEKSGGGAPSKRTEHARLDAIVGICHSAGCRRKALMCHFGDEAPDHCGNCDNCIAPPAGIAMDAAARRLIEIVRVTGQRYEAADIAAAASGQPPAKMRLDAAASSVPAEYGGLDIDAWRAVLRQMIATGVLTVDHAARGALVLTDAAADVMAGERAVSVLPMSVQTGSTAAVGAKSARRRTRPTASSTTQVQRPRRRRASGSSTDRSPLYDALRRECDRIARRAGVKRYFVFHEQTLRAMADARPRNGSEMMALRGVGPAKVEKYGGTMLSIIAAYA